MAEIIRTYSKDSHEYDMLERACAVLTATSKKGITYKVEDTYFDFGQNWMWTTIIAHDPNSCFGSYQAVCPRDYEKILCSDDLLGTLVKVKADKFWNDK